jgi:hypothetical protein
MMKRLITAAVGALLFLAVPSQGTEVQMRLSAGLWRLSPDEVNAALAGWRDGLEKTAAASPGWRYVSGEDRRLRLGVDFEAELILSFSRWLKLGLSAGFVQSSTDEEATLVKIDENGTGHEFARPTTVSAFPFLVSGYFNLPLGRKLNAYLRAGAGWIQARYVSREAEKEADDNRFTYPLYDNAQAGRPAYLGAVGFGYSFDQSLGFFVEAAVRFARVDGFSGENDQEEKGTLYSYEEEVSPAGVWEPRMHVFPAAPSGPGVREVREAVVDFGGYSIKIGVSLKF